MTVRKLVEMHTAASAKVESELTIKKRRMAVDKLESLIGRVATLQDLDSDLIISAFKNSDLENSTRNSYLSPIRSAWEWGHSRGYVDRGPDLPNFKVRPKRPVAMTKLQMRTVLETAKKYSKTFPSGMPGSVFFEGLFMLMAADGGERIGACLQIEKDWFYPDRGLIYIPGFARKDGYPKTHVLRPDTLESINRVADMSPGPLLFESGLSYSAILGRWKTILRRAGLPANRDYSFHGLRRTCYTHLTAAGEDAGAALGHKSDQSARYNDTVVSGARNACESIIF